MAKFRKQGTTLIELIVSTVVVTIIMTTVLMIWQGNNATASQCTKIINNVSRTNTILNEISRSVENLVYPATDQPLAVEYHSQKVFIKMHTRYKIITNEQYVNGPFITEFELDTKTGQLKSRQTPSMAFDDSYTYNNDNWQIQQTNINDISIENISGKKFYPIKITLNTNNNNDNFYQMVVTKHSQP